MVISLSIDTARDYRILVAEDAIARLENRVKVWNLPYPLNKGLALEKVKQLRSELMKIKYSFLPLDMLLEHEAFRSIESIVRELISMLLPPRGTKIEGDSQRLAVAEIRYSLWVLMGLRARLSLGEENRPEYAVDVVGVEVGYVEKHPRADKLWIAKMGTENYSFTVVTNIHNLRKGEVRGIAILPPTDFFGVISEAMICTDPLPREYKGKRIPLDLVHRAELVNQVEAIVKRLSR